MDFELSRAGVEALVRQEAHDAVREVLVDRARELVFKKLLIRLTIGILGALGISLVLALTWVSNAIVNVQKAQAASTEAQAASTEAEKANTAALEASKAAQEARDKAQQLLREVEQYAGELKGGMSDLQVLKADYQSKLAELSALLANTAGPLLENDEIRQAVAQAVAAAADTQYQGIRMTATRLEERQGEFELKVGSLEASVQRVDAIQGAVAKYLYGLFAEARLKESPTGWMAWASAKFGERGIAPVAARAAAYEAGL